MNLSGKEYQAYVIERDWAEFAAKNKVPAGYDHAETYGIFVYYRSGNNSFSDANIIYSGMEKAGKGRGPRGGGTGSRLAEDRNRQLGAAA